MPIPLTLPIFIEKANLRHNLYYLYDNAHYTNSHTKLTITCPVHGHFQMTPNNHLNGQGCKLCITEKAANARTKATKVFIQQAKAIHADT